MAEQCKCGSLDFFMKKQGNNTGLYCSMCGKWQKWMNKDDIRLFEHNHKPKARNTIKQTNADRIRKMNDEELAEFLLKVNTANEQPCMLSGGDCKWEDYPTRDKGCKDCFLEYLRKEVKGSE